MDLGQLAFFLVMSTIVLVNYVYQRDMLYPAFIQSAVWTAVIGLYYFYQDLVFPLSGLFLSIVLGGTILFSLGCYASCRGFRVDKTPLRDLTFEPKTWYMRVLYWLPILGVVPFVLMMVRLAEEGMLGSFYQNLRWAVKQEVDQTAGGTFGIMAYLIPISFVSVGVQVLLERYKTHRAAFALSVVTALVYAVFASGRTFVLFVAILVFGILLITRRVSAFKTLAFGALGGIALFLGLGLLAGQGGVLGEDLEAQGLRDIFIVYSLGSLPAFDEFMHMNIDQTWGQYVFHSVYGLLAKLGFDVEVTPLVQEFVLVPFPTNVYTVYQPYFADFGVVGLILMPLAYGFLHGFVYRRAAGGHLFCIVLYALLLFPLVFQFFQDTYLTHLSMWTQYLILLFLFFYRVRILVPQSELQMTKG